MASENRPNPLELGLDLPSSPYFLQSSDQPGIAIVLEQLDESNYQSWSKQIMMTLDVKNKTGFVDGTIKMPDAAVTPILYAAWKRANALVRIWIINSCTPDIRASHLSVTFALDLWLELETRFTRSVGPRVFHLEKSLSNFRQGANTISVYYGGFKKLWDEYVSLRPVSKCVCGGNAEIVASQHSDGVIKFLVGLNDSYASIRSQILMQVPIPSLVKIYSILLQEEGQRGLTSYDHGVHSQDSMAMMSKQQVSDSENMACFVKNTYLRGQNKDKTKPKCSNCGLNGHTVKSCYQIIGFPPGW